MDLLVAVPMVPSLMAMAAVVLVTVSRCVSGAGVVWNGSVVVRNVVRRSGTCDGGPTRTLQLVERRSCLSAKCNFASSPRAVGVLRWHVDRGRGGRGWERGPRTRPTGL